MSVLVLRPSEAVKWNGKRDRDDRDLARSVAHELLAAFSDINWDCQKIAEHANFSHFGSHGWSDDCYLYSVDSRFISDGIKSGIPDNFKFKYADGSYTVRIELEK